MNTTATVSEKYTANNQMIRSLCAQITTDAFTKDDPTLTECATWADIGDQNRMIELLQEAMTLIG